MTTVMSGMRTRNPKAAYAPRKTASSATNPTSPGGPRDARKETIMNVESFGVTGATPPGPEAGAHRRAPGPPRSGAPPRAGRRRRRAHDPRRDPEGHEAHVAHARE